MSLRLLSVDLFFYLFSKKVTKDFEQAGDVGHLDQSTLMVTLFIEALF